MKILLVEDEAKMGDYLKRGLTEAGFPTDWVQDGLTGQQLAMEDEYDLLVLDVMLPERDGYAVLRHLRAAGKEMPVMFLTARDQIDDRVHGLGLGADDYLVKPFAFPNSWRACAACCGAPRFARERHCRWPTSNWTCVVDAPFAAASASTSPRRNSRYSNC
jgi:CheY-like chemotaxis protein